MTKKLQLAADLALPHRGYLASCAQCGAIVVHARSTGKPFHMHRYSKRCRETAAKMKGSNG